MYLREIGKVSFCKGCSKDSAVEKGQGNSNYNFQDNVEEKYRKCAHNSNIMQIYQLLKWKGTESEAKHDIVKFRLKQMHDLDLLPCAV
jgi:hypothetical protein